MLALCRSKLTASESQRARVLLGQAIDWPQFVQWANLHGVVALVRHNLLALEAISLVPRQSGRELEQAAAQIAFDGMVHGRQLAQVVAALCAAGIDPIVLKGHALADLVYEDPVYRPSADLDILVRRDELAPACAALQQIGCTLPAPAAVDLQLANSYDLPCMLPPMAGIATLLELHWDLAPRGIFALDLDTMRSRAEPFRLGGQTTALRFSPEDMLLHLALHMRKHRYVGLRWLCDVAELLRRFAAQAGQRALDWRYVQHTARSSGLSVLLYTTLVLAQRLLDAPVPPGELALLEPSPARRWLLQSILSQQTLLAPLEREDAGWTKLAPVEILLVDRPAAMTQELVYRLFPPPEAVLGAEAVGMSRREQIAFQVRRLAGRANAVLRR